MFAQFFFIHIIFKVHDTHVYVLSMKKSENKKIILKNICPIRYVKFCYFSLKTPVKTNLVKKCEKKFLTQALAHVHLLYPSKKMNNLLFEFFNVMSQILWNGPPECTDVCWDNQNMMHFHDYDNKLLIWCSSLFNLHTSPQYWHFTEHYR